MPWRSKGAGLLGIGWVGLERSPGTVLLGTGVSFIGQIGLPVLKTHLETLIIAVLYQKILN